MVMANDVETQKSLREALYETLLSVLSPDHDERTAAEGRMQVLEVTEEFGVHLTEFILEASLDISIRQLASVILRNYVECHWSCDSEKFRSPELCEAAKSRIRHNITEGLKEPCSKVRTAVAYVVATIAHWDWPDRWPELLDILLACLSGDNTAVLGAMRVLTEFSADLADTQLSHVAPSMLSEMYRIFSSEQKYDTSTRSRAVQIFSNCTYMICATSEYQKGLSKSLLQPVLPMYIVKFAENLQSSYGPYVDPGLKAEIIKALTMLIQRLPRQLLRWMPQILPPVWQTLVQASEIYFNEYVNAEYEKEELLDSDGEVIGYEAVIYGIFELVDTLIDSSHFRRTVEAVLGDLIYYLILFTEITGEQMKIWNENPSRYFEEEDENTFCFSVRISAVVLLESLFQVFEEIMIGPLSHAITKHLQASEIERNGECTQWWKSHEACMCALDTASDIIIEKLEKDAKIDFDLIGFLQNIVIADMNLASSPYLLARCLCIGASYINTMSPHMIQQFLQATVSGLQENQAHQIRIFAVRAVYRLCKNLKQSENLCHLKAVLPPFMDGLMGLINQYSSEFLYLVLESVATVLSIDEAFTVSCASRVTSLAIAVFLKFNSDPLIVGVALDIFKELSQSEESLAKVQHRLVPTLVSIFNSPPEKIASGLPAASLDALQTLVRNSKAPLSEVLINTAFPAAVHCVLKTSDHSVMQNGGECLRTYISVSPDQVFRYQDADGQTGLGYLLQVAALLLNPASSEFTASFVGQFVVTLISKAGSHLGENIDVLLKAVLSKMQRAKTLSVIQGLIMVYAHLIHSQLEAVLNFLATVPGPTGQSALHFVLEEWCSRHSSFSGAYEVKVSTLALCKLLEYGVTHNDERLNMITVKGDQVYINKDTGGIKTRSQVQSSFQDWTTVPLLVKVFKILLNELNDIMETKAARTDLDDESDDEWEDDDDNDETDNSSKALVSAEDTLQHSMEDVSECDDPDILKDPLYHVNLSQYLTDYLVSLSQQPYFHIFSQHLTEGELRILSTVKASVQ